MFEGKPLSFLAMPGAMDVGIELHSMSKAFNMTGWRMGFVVGNPLIVKAYADVKDNTDSGQFLAIQQACAYALDHMQITQKIAAKYTANGRARRGIEQGGAVGQKAKRVFLSVREMPASAAGKDGSRVEFPTAEAFSQWMIGQKLISTVPWDDVGAYVRFSVTFLRPRTRRTRGACWAR